MCTSTVNVIECVYVLYCIVYLYSAQYLSLFLLGSVTVQSVTLAGLSVTVPDRLVKFTGQSVTFTDWVIESGKFVNDKP